MLLKASYQRFRRGEITADELDNQRDDQILPVQPSRHSRQHSVRRTLSKRPLEAGRAHRPSAS
jgi:hypothetical protein